MKDLEVIVGKKDLVNKTFLFSIIAIGIALRLWHINWGLPDIYEEAMPLSISWKFWNWNHPGLDLNPHFYTYPSFTFYLQFIIQSIHYLIGHVVGLYPDLEAFRRAYEVDPTIFATLARLTTLFFDIATVIVVYILGMRYADRRVAVLASLLVAINPLHIMQSHLINVDTPLTFFSTLSVLLFYKIYTEPTTKWYILAGVCIGLATATKYNGALLIVVLIFIHLLRATSVAQALQLIKSSRLYISIALSLLVFIIFNPYIFLNFHNFTNDFYEIQRHMTGGHLGLDPKTTTLEYYFLESIPNNIGWGLFAFLVVSVVIFIIKREKKNLIILIFPVMYISIFGSWAMRADRYIFPIFPMLILSGTIGLFLLIDLINGYARRHHQAKLIGSRLFRNSLNSILGIVIIAPLLINDLKYHQTFSKPDTRSLAKKWIMENLAPGSAIATPPYGIELPESTFTVLHIPFLALNSERVIAFYDTRWYEDLDLVIASDFDYGRYLQEPQKYAEYIDYYNTLETKWTLVFEAKRFENQSGPAIWLYKPPDSLKKKLFDNEVLQRLNSAPESANVSNFLKRLTTILMQKPNLTKAEQLSREIISVKINVPENHTNLASILYNLGKIDEAFDEVETSLLLKSDQPPALALKGLILFQKNRLNEAEVFLKRAIIQNKNLEFAYSALLLIYVNRKDKPNAIDILSRHYEILPKNSEKARLVAADLQRLKSMP